MAGGYSVDPLVVGRVIGDVVDMFVPAVSVSVYFGSKHVTNGCDIKPSISITPPKLTISGHSQDLYTLLLRKEILPYVGPRPPVGIHRYILVLFRQKGPLGLVDQPPCRANFNTRFFAAHLDLGLPVATVYFNSQKEPATKRR
ncbi:hypothetical protein F8388_025277 [Cannabis sativa]|uniref:Uncharacterized protein n=1 Tax=Cannabis sativa TaxID=3483 RepID=A0A7J6FS93_CANSA|nr:hypothetical protein F8388_025277 [Cannabis sativa]